MLFDETWYINSTVLMKFTFCLLELTSKGVFIVERDHIGK